jgi:hypothetical protein
MNRSPRDRPGRAAGVSRAALLLAGAVVAATLVLVAGALRSGATQSPAPSTASSGLGSLGTASLPPVPTPASTVTTTPEPPEPTEISGLRGEFVGPLGHVETCPILYERDGVLELVLPDGYRSRVRGGAIEIAAPGGAIVATEGDLLGLNGRVREGGSLCMSGPQLHVSKIVDVLPRADQ